jgi:hypothetical protein
MTRWSLGQNSRKIRALVVLLGVSVILGVVYLLLTFVFGQKGTAFATSDGRFELRAPSDWVDVSRSNPDALLLISDTGGTAAVQLDSQSKASLPDAGLSDYAQKSVDSLLAAMQEGREVSGPTSGRVGDFPTFESEITGSLQGRQFVYLMVTLEVDDDFVQILGFSKPENYDSVKGDIRQIMGSFRVTG